MAFSESAAAKTCGRADDVSQKTIDVVGLMRFSIDALISACRIGSNEVSCADEINEKQVVRRFVLRLSGRQIVNRYVAAIIGPTRLGMIEYFCFPEQRDPWGGTFNNQHKRR